MSSQTEAILSLNIELCLLFRAQVLPALIGNYICLHFYKWSSSLLDFWKCFCEWQDFIPLDFIQL